MPHSRTVTVELGERSYPIIIGSGLIDATFDMSPFLAGRDGLIVSNETVAPLYLDRIRGAFTPATLHSIALRDGESYKTPASVASIIDKLVEIRANRDVTVIALGGGVVGDIAGFAAACYMRGVAFLQVPTTLLAQVDSSVGGKTGVNHPQGKNLIGAFHQPNAVLIDTDTLDTLPEREYRAGLAEVIKYGAIVDAEFFGWLENNVAALLQKDPDALGYAITRSCELKAAIVADDEKEAGRRALLNFGHTFGHAIEHSLGYGQWLHGEAVAAGMVMAAKLSGIDDHDQARLAGLIETAGLPTRPPDLEKDALLAAMKMDKKVVSKKMRFILLRCLGDAFVTEDYDEALLDAVLSELGS